LKQIIWEFSYTVFKKFGLKLILKRNKAKVRMKNLCSFVAVTKKLC